MLPPHVVRRITVPERLLNLARPRDTDPRGAAKRQARERGIVEDTRPNPPQPRRGDRGAPEADGDPRNDDPPGNLAAWKDGR